MTVDDLSPDLDRVDALIGMRRYDDACAIARRVLATDAHNARAACLLSRAELEAEHYQQALQAAQLAILAAPDDEWPHRLASAAAMRLNDRSRAIAEAREAVRLAPNISATHVTLAQALFDSLPSEAKAHAERAVELAPHDPMGHFVVGRIAHRWGSAKDAEAAWLRALELDPNHAPSHNELGRLKLRRGLKYRGAAMAEAATGFATAVRADPYSEVARRNLELVMTAFLRRAAYLVFVSAWIGLVYTDASKSEILRLLPVILLLLPALYCGRVVSRLEQPLRRFLLTEIRRRSGLQIPIGMQVLAVAAVIGEVFTPGGARVACAVTAGLAALGARVLLARSSRQTRR